MHVIVIADAKFECFDSDDDFEIPDFSDYQQLLTINFNVRQLKSICRFYKQKVGGNKPQLIHLLYN